jgi:HEAT repeat protein
VKVKFFAQENVLEVVSMGNSTVAVGRSVTAIMMALLIACGCNSQPNRPPEDSSRKAAADDPILGPAELHHLRAALRCIKMTPVDLTYKKNQMPDLPYRLKVVDRLMANPIDVPFYTDECARGIGRQETLPGLIDFLAAQIDLVPGAGDAGAKADSNAGAAKDLGALSGGLDALPAEVNAAMRILITGMHESGGLVKRALAGMSPEGKTNLAEKGESFEAWTGYESVSREKLLLAGRVMLEAVEKARSELRKAKPVSGRPAAEFGLAENRVKGGVLFCAKTGIGEIIVGDSGPNEYVDDFSLIVDLGGDDLYTARAGGTDGRTQPPVAVCIDLGGSDRFIARLKDKPPEKGDSDKLNPADWRIDFCQGAALAGVGILVADGDGDDTFAAGNWSQGAARLGVGVLIRSGKGNDSYKGLDCVQGASSFGIGVLKDEEGNDKYKATCFSQGFGGPAGLGLLWDVKGDDSYYAGGRYDDYPTRPKGSFIAMSQGFGFGLRPVCSGGTGIMLDNAGNDFRHLDNQFGMGGSYWYAFGMSVDDAGDDVYQTGKAGDYDGYTMGAPIHLTAACLIDRGGNDKYHGNKIGPAVGWDLSPGWFVDGGGNDEFTACKDGWNFMAGGIQNGCGFLVKKSGGATFDGGAYPRGEQCRDCGSIGILLNLGGKGKYSAVTPQMRPDLWFSGGSWDGSATWCAGIDGADPAGNEPDEKLSDWPRREMVLPKKYDDPALEGIDAVARGQEIKGVSPEDLDKLWVDAVKETGANWDKTSVARDKLKALGVPLLNYVIPKLTSENYYESICASGLIVPLCQTDKSALSVLLEHLKLKDKGIRRMIIMKLGDIGDKGATEAILPLASHPAFIDVACEALGKLRDRRATKALLDLYDVEIVKDMEGLRKQIAVALGRIGDPAAVPQLIKGLDEKYFWVRYPSEKALIDIGETSVPALMDVVKAGKFPACAHAIEALGKIKDKEGRAYPVLVEGLKNSDWAMRGFAAEALGDYGDKKACEVLETLKRTERHPFVVQKIDWARGKLNAPPPVPAK